VTFSSLNLSPLAPLTLSVRPCPAVVVVDFPFGLVLLITAPVLPEVESPYTGHIRERQCERTHFWRREPATGGEPLEKAAALSVCSGRLPEATQDEPSFLTFAYFRENRSDRGVGSNHTRWVIPGSRLLQTDRTAT
jgi:hypothetical protein